MLALSKNNSENALKTLKISKKIDKKTLFHVKHAKNIVKTANTKEKSANVMLN